MSAAGTQGRSSSESSQRKRPARRTADTKDTESKSRRDGAKGLGAAVRAAMEQFAELTGRTPESVTGARSLEDSAGWSVLVDVVELERIPSSTSVLATYRVDLDSDGSITSYERLRRYTRGATDAV